VRRETGETLEIVAHNQIVNRFSDRAYLSVRPVSISDRRGDRSRRVGGRRYERFEGAFDQPLNRRSNRCNPIG
jgi:hypothetical protein